MLKTECWIYNEAEWRGRTSSYFLKIIFLSTYLLSLLFFFFLKISEKKIHYIEIVQNCYTSSALYSPELCLSSCWKDRGKSRRMARGVGRISQVTLHLGMPRSGEKQCRKPHILHLLLMMSVFCEIWRQSHRYAWAPCFGRDQSKDHKSHRWDQSMVVNYMYTGPWEMCVNSRATVHQGGLSLMVPTFPPGCLCPVLLQDPLVSE